MTNRIPLKAKYTGSDTTSLGEFESTDTIDNSYLNTGTAASQLVVLDASARLPAISGANLTDLPATGATTAQANAITANTAKVTNSTSATDLTSGTLADARFPATLPAVDGSLLTGISSGGASDINGLTDGYNVGNSVGLGTDALANDDGTYNRNTAVGSNALTTNTTGPYNTAIGWSALKLNTTGTANTATGYGTLINNTTGGYNTANGLMSSFANTTGGHNTASGTYALKFNTTGGHNTANGDTALHSNTTASYNTASGAYALRLNTTGTKNVGLGYGAGDAITTGSNNTIIGDYAGTTTLADTVVIAAGTTERLKIDASGIQVNGAALAAGATSIDGLTDGYNDASSVGLGTNALANDDGTTNRNTAVGTDALKHNTTGYQNSASGYKALNNNTTGNNNNANGYTALASNTIGSYNTATGGFALASNTTGNRNTATGVFALGNSNGSQNTASGFYALMYNTGSRNTASGYKALENNTYGTRNIGIGNRAGDAITTGSNNTVIGDLAGTTAMASTVLIAAGTTERLKVDSTGLYVNGSATALAGGGASDIDGLTDGYNVGGSVGLGTGALANDDGTANQNTAIGTSALTANTSGTHNTAAGYKALENNTTGSRNTASGYRALKLNTTANNNTASGFYALKLNTTGGSNVAYGFNALYSNTTGAKNIGLGYGAGGGITTGSNNTIIGDYAGTSTLADTVVIAAGTTERLKIDSTGLYVNGSATALGGGGGGNWSLISTTNITSAITSLLMSGDYSAYSQLRIIITNLTGSANGEPRLNMSNDNGTTLATWDNTSAIVYNHAAVKGSATAWGTTYAYFLDATFRITTGSDAATIVLDIYTDGGDISMVGRADGMDTGGDHCFCMSKGIGSNQTSTNYINITNMNWSTGKVRLFGFA